MKKIIYILFLIISLTSCINGTIQVKKDNTVFVVTSIKQIDKNYALYTYKVSGDLVKYEIIMPVGWYNISDTIKLNKIK